MSQTFSSAAYAHVGAGVTFKGGVGALDMIATGSYLIALVTFIDGIHAYRSTDGATWTVSNTNEIGSGLLANSVQSGEDIDAGLLAEIGGEIVAAVWDEDNGQIIFIPALMTATTTAVRMMQAAQPFRYIPHPALRGLRSW